MFKVPTNGGFIRGSANITWFYPRNLQSIFKSKVYGIFGGLCNSLKFGYLGVWLNYRLRYLSRHSHATCARM